MKSACTAKGLKITLGDHETCKRVITSPYLKSYLTEVDRKELDKKFGTMDIEEELQERGIDVKVHRMKFRNGPMGKPPNGFGRDARSAKYVRGILEASS